METGKFVIARDVTVDEKSFLLSRPVIQSQRVQLEDSCGEPILPEIMARNSGTNIISEGVSGEKMTNKGDAISDTSVDSEENIDNTSNHSFQETAKEKTNNNDLRRSKRIMKQKPISYNETEHWSMLAEANMNDTPISYNDIKNRNDKVEWEKAMREELDSHYKNETWSIVQRPTNKNIVDCKWVFTIKCDELGNAVRYKARLVARGFTQEYQVDYDETFAPVARIASFRLILAFANQFNLLVHHMDVKTAFLNGTLEEEIFMEIPEGVASRSNSVCKLNKAIYGLKQAARRWFQVFDDVLKERGFTSSAVDRCVYVLDNNNIKQNIYIVLYVDDVVIATSSLITMTNFKNFLMSKFLMTDLKDIKHFLGIRIERNNKTISLSQSVYINKVISKFNMSTCKPVNTPLPSKIIYENLNSDEIYDAPCRSLIGCLMYIMICTRPDISVAINILSRYSNKNNKELWQCLKRVLRYLRGSSDLKLEYSRENYDRILTGYADSDWGGSENTDRKSTTGYIFQLFGSCLISWNTKRQSSVAASSTEAEYMALFESVREALWLKSLVQSIHLEIKQPIVIFEDNNGCISVMC